MQEIYNKLITWPSIYGYDDDDDVSDSQDASPCEEDIVIDTRTSEIRPKDKDEYARRFDPRN